MDNDKSFPDDFEYFSIYPNQVNALREVPDKNAFFTLDGLLQDGSPAGINNADTKFPKFLRDVDTETFPNGIGIKHNVFANGRRPLRSGNKTQLMLRHVDRA
jgi:hypothetical protein